MTPMRRVAATAIPATLLLALAACSASVGGTHVSSDDLAEQVSSQLAEYAGRAPEKVECPDDLEGKVGAAVRCTLTDSGETYGISVTATAVDGNTVKFDIEVDQEPVAE